MKISYAYKKINEIMKIIEDLNFIDFKSIKGRLENQKRVNKAYKMLDEFKAEMERESIKSNQKRNKV